MRVRESAGSGRDGGRGERRESMCACETKRGAEREGERRVLVCVLCVCVCFSVVIILIT